MYKKQKPLRRCVSFSPSASSFRIGILFILLIFSLSLSIITMLYISQHQQALAQTKDAFLPYENTTYGIKMQYPAGWQGLLANQTSEDNVVNYIVAFRSPPDRVSDAVTESVIVAMENLPPEENISLDTYSTVLITNLQSETNFDLEQSIPTVLAGSPAYKIVFSETFQQIPLKKMQVWTIKDNKAYIITFSAEAAKYSTYLPTVQKMIDSFELINSTRGSNNSTVQSSTTNQ